MKIYTISKHFILYLHTIYSSVYSNLKLHYSENKTRAAYCGLGEIAIFCDHMINKTYAAGADVVFKSIGKPQCSHDKTLLFLTLLKIFNCDEIFALFSVHHAPEFK